MFCFEGVVLTKNPKVYNQLHKNLVSDLILIKQLIKLQYSTLPQSWDTGSSSPRLSLKIKTQKFLVLDLVLIFRLEKFQSQFQSKLRLRKFQSWSQNWDSGNFRFGSGLEIKTQIIWVSDLVSKLRLWKYKSHTGSQN